MSCSSVDRVQYSGLAVDSLAGDQVDTAHVYKLSRGLLPSPLPSGTDESSMTPPNAAS